MLRHLLTARDRSVFDRNMAMMRALGAGEPVTRVAKRYGVTRQWIHRPRSVHNRTSGEVRALIAQVRERLLAGGWDCGARSIHGVLAERMGRAPSVSTIHRILQDMGLVEAEPRKRPRSSYVRFEAELPNETWQSDFTHWPLADGTDAQIITWLDDHSRMVLLSRATGSVTGELVARTFLECCAEHGTPASTLTANGGVYTSRLIVGAKGPGAFERILAE
ncbi:transposase, partial [Bifidobacterium pseudolongum]|nr:transposase [Bifidobacterium pseudolongum]